MSDAAIKPGLLSGLVRKLPSAPGLSGAGRAGPRRLMFGTAALVVFVAGAAYVAFSGVSPIAQSQDARMKSVDPLPGGLMTTPEQDAMALKANEAQAKAAKERGVSFTPQIAPSRPVLPAALKVEEAAALPAVLTGAAPWRPRPEPHAVVAPPPHPVFRSTPVAFTLPAEPVVAAHPDVIAVAAMTPADQAAQQSAYNRALGDLFNQWGGHMPHTDVTMPPKGDQNQTAGDGQDSGETPTASRPPSLPNRSSAASALVLVSTRSNEGRLLVPAGHGVFAHPVLAVNSDAASPVVLQADTGPLAGDRMIGTFSKQEDRLVIHIGSVEHHGESIGVDGVVIAPDTMEAAVASDVDQHYVSRFILPAAAAFVSGLGQAIAQTSNTAAVLSPFGGVSTSTNLNFHQQLGVAAGTAASQIGSTLNQSAPKGPTVSLEPNVSIGVMFLANVTAHNQQ